MHSWTSNDVTLSPPPVARQPDAAHIFKSTEFPIEYSRHTTLSTKQSSRKSYQQSSDTDPFSFVDIPLVPPSPAITTSSSPQNSPIESGFCEKRSRSYRQSLTDAILDQAKLPPLLTRATTVSSRASSPTRSHHHPQSPQSASPSASKVSTRAHHRHSRSLFENFFSPYSSPGPEEYPAAEDFEMESSYTRFPNSGRSVKSPTPSLFSNSIGEKFSWFISKPSGLSKSPVLSSSPTRPSRDLGTLIESDSLYMLDINRQLFPDGPVDTLDPSSFHTLLANATSLAQTLHKAYKSRVMESHNQNSELAAQTDELDEAETRARHLKMQLSDMSARMTDTETSLRTQLVEETRRRQAAEVQLQELLHGRKHQRIHSSATSDSGFESDLDNNTSPTLHNPFSQDQSIGPPRELTRPTAVPRTKVEERTWNPHRASIAVPLQGGGDLLIENADLKQRIADLEAAVDACLQLI